MQRPACGAEKSSALTKIELGFVVMIIDTLGSMKRSEWPETNAATVAKGISQPKMR